MLPVLDGRPALDMLATRDEVAGVLLSTEIRIRHCKPNAHDTSEIK